METLRMDIEFVDGNTSYDSLDIGSWEIHGRIEAAKYTFYTASSSAAEVLKYEVEKLIRYDMDYDYGNDCINQMADGEFIKLADVLTIIANMTG